MGGRGGGGVARQKKGQQRRLCVASKSVGGQRARCSKRFEATDAAYVCRLASYVRGFLKPTAHDFWAS